MSQVIEIKKQNQAELPKWNLRNFEESPSSEAPSELSAFENGVRLCKCGIETICTAGSGGASG